jgi:hypothetical protein
MKAICATVVKLAAACLLTYFIVVHVLGLFPAVGFALPR